MSLSDGDLGFAANNLVNSESVNSSFDLSVELVNLVWLDASLIVCIPDVAPNSPSFLK